MKNKAGMDLKEIGKTLKEARLKKNLEKDKVFKNTRIHPRIIEAIEDGTALKTLSKPYVRGFLKKYAEFLELDSIKLIEDFDSLRLEAPKQVLTMESKDRLREDKKIWYVPTAAIVAGLFIVFIMFLGLSVRFFKSRRPSPPPVRNSARPITEPAKEAPAPETAKKTSAKRKPASFTLALRANQDVWVRVTKDGNRVFEGILPAGTEEKWQADDSINVRSGKTEALEIIIDGRSKGIVGNGVRDILVTKEGVELR